MTTLTLFQLSEQFKGLEAVMESGDMPEQVILDTLEGLQGDIKDKAVNVAYAIRNLEAAAESIKAAAKAMAERAVRVQNRADSIRNYLLFNLLATGVTKIETPEFTIAVRDNPVSVIVNEDAQVPAKFMVQPEPPPPRADKKALKQALEAGEEIRGVWLQRGQSVEIRT